MAEQRVTGPDLRGWQGVGVIALAVLAVAAGSAFFDWLGGRIGSAASGLFIAYGVLVALFLLERYVMCFVYGCRNGCLKVCRRYGRYERLAAEVWLNGIQACGPLDAMRARFPGAKLHRAVRRECPIEPLAVAYNDAGSVAILLLQPNDELRAQIVRAAKG